MIITEENKYSTKDITKFIRQKLKSTFKDLKFSVSFDSYSGGSSVSIIILESKKIRFLRKFEEITEQEKLSISSARNDTIEEVNNWMKTILSSGNHQINQYHIESDWSITDKAKEILKGILKIVNKYNWDNSDSMTDYFDVNYYLSIDLGKYYKPFVDGVE